MLEHLVWWYELWLGLWDSRGHFISSSVLVFLPSFKPCLHHHITKESPEKNEKWKIPLCSLQQLRDLFDSAHTIRKVKFLTKYSIWQSPTFIRVFHQIIFWQFFSWNQSCQQLKSPKPMHFHEFLLKTIRQFFSGNQRWLFGQKIEISNSVKWNWI